MGKLQQGSLQNESYWCHLQASFPKSFGVSFGDVSTKALKCGWNFHREVLFNDNWTYLPISTMHIILTQDLALQSKSHLSSTSRVCTMLCPLSLSLSNCDKEFGMTTSYFDSLPTLPKVSFYQKEGLSVGITSLVDYAMWDNYTIDQISK